MLSPPSWNTVRNSPKAPAAAQFFRVRAKHCSGSPAAIAWGSESIVSFMTCSVNLGCSVPWMRAEMHDGMKKGQSYMVQSHIERRCVMRTAPGELFTSACTHSRRSSFFSSVASASALAPADMCHDFRFDLPGCINQEKACDTVSQCKNTDCRSVGSIPSVPSGASVSFFMPDISVNLVRYSSSQSSSACDGA